MPDPLSDPDAPGPRADQGTAAMDGNIGGWMSGACIASYVSHAERVLMLPHLPARPSWDCTACGEPWPCLIARINLRRNVDDEELRHAMAAFMRTAEYDGHPLSPAQYNRFFRWIDADQVVNTAARAVGYASVAVAAVTQQLSTGARLRGEPGE